MIRFDKQLKFREMLQRYIKRQCDWSRCFYCGRNSSAEDHVLPVSVLKQLPFINWPTEVLQLVPSCTQCNSIAGARLFTTLLAKKRYIETELNKRAIQLYLNQMLELGNKKN